MNLRAGASILALALLWVACHDRSFELAGDTGAASSVGGTQAQGPSAVDGNQPSSTAGNTPSTGTATSGYGNGDPTGMSSDIGNFATPCFDDCPTSSTGTGNAPNSISGGGGAFSSDHGTTSTYPGPDNTAGQGPTGGCSGPGDPDCFDCAPENVNCWLCSYARNYCEIPTLDCPNWRDVCERCNENTPCTMPGQRCFRENGQCRTACESDQACPPDQVCDPVEGVCVHCDDDAGCADGAHCLAGRCVQCRTAERDCPRYEPHCVAGLCNECVSSIECDYPKPLCYAGRCVECIQDRDCGNGQVCINAACSSL